MGQRGRRRALGIGSVALALSLIMASAGATPLAPGVAFEDEGQGLSVAESGVGLEDLGAGTKTITVTIPGPVSAAFLYWAGRDLTGCDQGACFEPPNSEPFGDQQLNFDGNPITGSISGTEGSATGNIGYFSDVTPIVQAKGTGVHSFSISDADLGNNLDRLSGAGLIVLYNDPGDPGVYRVTLYDGLDFAWEGGPSPENMVTSPVSFNFTPSAAARTGQLTLFVADAESARPDRIDITHNASVVNALDGSDGGSYDTDTFAVNIPAAENQLTTQVFSVPAGQNADSLLWQLALLRIPVPQQQPPGDDGCSPGYWKNHTASWGPTGFSPGQTVDSVFTVPSALSSLGSQTLLDALKGGGGPGATGGAKILLRAATAAVLNADHPDVDFPRTSSEVIADTNAALASNDRDTMLSLATALDNDNNGGCPLN